MDRVQAESALNRALELESADPGGELLDRAALDRIGQELGIAPDTLDVAVTEVLSAPAGPLNAAAARTIDAPAPELDRAIATMLRLRGLTTDGNAVWRQESGWWPDLFRYRAVTPVAVSVVASGRSAVVRLMARLDHMWRSHLVAAVVVPILAAFFVGIGEIAFILAFGAGWVALSLIGYQYRRDAVRQRLEQALRELARPDYRSQPW